MRQLPVLMVVLLSLLTASYVMGEEKKEKEDNRPPYYLTDTELDKKLGVDEQAEAPKEYVCRRHLVLASICLRNILTTNNIATI